MKKTILISAGLFTISFLSAQETIINPDGSHYKQCSEFYISRPLRELAAEHPAPTPDGIKRMAGDENSPTRRIKRYHDADATPVVDPSIQSVNGIFTAPAPIVNIDGQKSSQGYQPLDDNGMVGPNNYVQTVNSDYQVFDKTGKALTSSAALSALFPGSGDQGDPVTLYDKFADRWMIEEFDGSGYNVMMFAVSTTPDPTGTYYVFKFTPDASDFADYPKYTVWADGYYQTCNCQNDKVVVYERAKMLVGDKTAGFISIPWTNPNTGGGFFCPMTMSADGSLPPYGSPNYLLYYNSSSWGGGYTNEIVIDKITVNWTAKTGSYSAYQTLPTTAVNDVFSAKIDQPGATNTLDPLDGFFSYRIPYMRWGTYNSAVMVSTVNIGTASKPVAALRWYEIRQDTTSKQWSIHQFSTYGPSDGVSRWNASIAMNNNGDIAMGYTASNASNVYPSDRYTGRSACDALNTMTVTEQTALAGASSDNGGSGRWGDYSDMSIDPSDGLTFWNTNMYVKSGSMATRIYSFQVPHCSPTAVPTVTENSTVLSAYQSGSMLNVKAVSIPDENRVNVELYTLEGKYVMSSSHNPASGIVETNFNISTLAKGIYLVRIGNDNFQRVVKVTIQ